MSVQPNTRPLVPGKKGCFSNPPEDHTLVTNTRIATWNVRGLNEDFKTDTLIKEMKRLKINILGLSETHWTTEIPETFEKSSYSFLQAGNKDIVKRRGVGIILDQESRKALLDYKLISERLLSVTVNTLQGPLTIFQVYAPDSSYDDETFYRFFDLLENSINELPIKQKFTVIGDFNAKVGETAGDLWPENAGKFGLGEINDRGQYLLQFCATLNLVISNTLFKHKPIKRATWTHPDGLHRNQIDFIIVQKKLKPQIKDSRVFNSASVSYTHLTLPTIYSV